MVMSSRKLDPLEATELLIGPKPKPVSESWPGTYNLDLIADAVNNRRQFVELDGKRFSIKYDERARAVYVKPTDNGYVPCGWFSYDELKGAIA